MAGLEQYQGMSADEKLTVLCVKMDNLERRLDATPPCPAPRCNEHERRLTALETMDRAGDRHGDNVIAWLGVIIAGIATVVAAWAVVA